MGQDGLASSISLFGTRMRQLASRYTRKRRRSHDFIVEECSSDLAVEGGCILITRIRATGIAMRMRRIPVGFYVVVKSENGTQRTSNKPTSVGTDMVEWDDKIVLSSDPSSTITLKVVASFELGPTLGTGEVLREIETTVGKLLDRGRQFGLIRFSEQGDGGVKIHLESRVHSQEEHKIASDPILSEEMQRLEELTSMGHYALIRHREFREQRHLDESIKLFEQARDLCPPDHLNHATVLFNLATANLVCCRTIDASPRLDISIDLYRTALRLRPRGHPDHPLTLLSLGVSLKARFQRQSNEPDEEEGNMLLSQVLGVSLADSYAYHAAILALGGAADAELVPETDASQVVENDIDDEDDEEEEEEGTVDRLDNILRRMFHAETLGHTMLDHLGILICVRLDCAGDLVEPEKAISMLDVVIQSTCDGHPDKSSWLNSLGVSLVTRYLEPGDPVDLERSVATTEKAVQFAADDDTDKPLRLTTLGNALLIRYEHSGDIVDLEKSISMREEALQLAQEDHPERAGLLSNLGHILSTRYERFGDIADLEKSISLAEEAVRLTPDDPEKSTWLSNLGCSLLTRYERCGDVADLEKSMSMLENALGLTPDGHPDKPIWLSNLGRILSTRYERFGDADSLEKSLSVTEDAVRLTPDGHPNKPTGLNNLGSLLSTRYERLGDINDLEKSILTGEDAVRLTSDGHLDKPKFLSNLASSLLTRYDRFGDITDLEKSISMREDALQLIPDGSPDKPAFLDNLGSTVFTRYLRFGNLVDLEDSVSMRENAVRLIPDGHPDKPGRLNNLGSSLLIRYERSGDVVDLERSTSAREDALRLTPDGHPDRPSILDHLGHSLLAHFERFGNVDALEKSVLVREEALRLTPQIDRSLNKPTRLNNLGRSLLARYERFGDIGDLEKSISMREDALCLTPEDHPDKPMRLENLANLLWTRYRHFGDVLDLEKLISTEEESLRLTSDGHPSKPSRLNGFGHSLLARYDRFGNAADLQQSVSVFEEVVQSIEDGHPDKAGALANLGTSLWTSYGRFGSIAHLETSVSVGQEAIQLTPADHPDRPMRLNNLANSLLTRHERLGQVIDLERAVSMREEAVELMPDDHPDKPTWFANLGSALLTHYRKFGDAIVLEKSISMFDNAVRSTPDGHPSRPSMLNSLTRSYLERFRHSGESPSDLLQGISCCSQASHSRTGPTSERFEATQLWVQCLCLLPHNPQSLFDVYTLSVELLPQLAWIGLSLHDRYHRLLQAADTVCDAAAAALELHRSELAVEWLEQGRSIMWSQLSQLRTPIDDLRSASPRLAAELERVSHGLERTGAGDRHGTHDFTDNSIALDRLLEKQIGGHNSLALRREELLADIRALPGFERFLLPKTIDQLSSLVHSGHIVLLNASKRRCDALVIMAASKKVVHVPLLHTSYDEIVKMRGQLSTVLRTNGRVILRDEIEPERGARLVRSGPDDVFRSILSILWNKVVTPILDVLGLSTPPAKLSRIFWCLTGPFTFLPIHAAGIYGVANHGPKLSEFAISSYIPTMSALEQPVQQGDLVTVYNTRLLAVPQSSTDGQRHLHGVKEEMVFMRELTSSSPFVSFREADGTVEDVIAKMKESDWVHFCCHGSQDQTNPLDSGLLLADGKRLKLSDIVQLSRPQGGLAFLSACQTAMGDEQLSGEAIHLAAGMLLAGYSGVIATMWSIMDSDAPRVTKHVYTSLFGDGRVPDRRRAAEALHRAVEGLRGSGAPFLSWVPFVHYGL